MRTLSFTLPTLRLRGCLTEAMMKNDLQTELLALAEHYAEEYYGCDLSRLDSGHLEAYCDRVTEVNLDDLALEMADAAWFEN